MGGVIFGDSIGVFVRFDGGGSFGLGGVGDSGFQIGVDLGEGAEEQAADVGEDGGAAGGDAVLSQKRVEVGERKVDALSGLEALRIDEQGCVEVSGLLLLFLREMPRAKSGRRVRDQETALTPAGSEMRATKGGCGGAMGLRFHVVPRLESGGDTPPSRGTLEKQC